MTHELIAYGPKHFALQRIDDDGIRGILWMLPNEFWELFIEGRA